MQNRQDALRGVAPSERPGGLRHSAQAIGVESSDGRDKSRAAQLRVAQPHGSASLDHGGRVLLLVAPAKRAWDEDHRQSYRRGLGDGTHARAPDDEVRARHQSRHVISESHSSVARTSVQFYACGALLGLAVVPTASLAVFVLIPAYYALTSEGLQSTHPA